MAAEFMTAMSSGIHCDILHHIMNSIPRERSPFCRTSFERNVLLNSAEGIFQWNFPRCSIAKFFANTELPANGEVHKNFRTNLEFLSVLLLSILLWKFSMKFLSILFAEVLMK